MLGQVTLEDSLKVSQIGFYVTIAVLTFLTFLRAKKTLLSPINTEYHKKVIERLDMLSTLLIEEFDFESDKHWSNSHPVIDAVKRVIEEFNEAREEILARGEFHGLPPNAQAARLSAAAQRIKTDPFIPPEIRDHVTDLLATRADLIEQFQLEELEKYTEQLATGARVPKKNDPNQIHNRIVRRLNEQGCGLTEVEAEVHDIRLAIQKYLQRFNPDA